MYSRRPAAERRAAGEAGGPHLALAPEPFPDALGGQCALGRLDDTVGQGGDTNKGPMTVMALLERPIRFNELRRRLEGVTRRVLARTPRRLERDRGRRRAIDGP